MLSIAGLSAVSAAALSAYLSFTSMDADKIQSLLAACENGDTTLITELIEREHISPNVCDERHGGSPLSVAAAAGHVGAVNRLLALGADPMASESAAGASYPIHLAAAAGHAMVIQALLDQTRDRCALVLDAQGQLPLHLACLSSEQLSAVECLLPRTPDINARRADGRTPLAVAASAGAAAIVCAILELSDCDTEVPDCRGCTALHHACAGRHRAAIEALLDAGACMFVSNYEGLTPMDMAIPQGPSDPAGAEAKATAAEPLHALFRRTHDERLRDGRREANLADAVRGRLMDRIGALGRTDPLLLNELCEEVHTARLLRRFDVDLAAVVPPAVLDDRGIALAAELHASRRVSPLYATRDEPSDLEGSPTARAAEALRRMRDALRADAPDRHAGRARVRRAAAV